MGTLDDYRDSLHKGREWFHEQHPNVDAAFQTLDDGLRQLGEILLSGRDSDGNAYMEATPLLFVLQRQAFVALDALSSAQAYQAWLLARPGVESALLIGKFFDDPANKDAWFRRREDPKQYRKRFGTGLSSQSLPASDRFQQALSAINDGFVHPNPYYVLRHLRIVDRPGGSVEVNLQFFDHHDFHWASVLGLLHLLITIQDSLARMFASRFANIDVVAERFGLLEFRNVHREAVATTLEREKHLGEVLIDMGAWDLAAGHRSPDV